MGATEDCTRDSEHKAIPPLFSRRYFCNKKKATIRGVGQGTAFVF